MELKLKPYARLAAMGAGAVAAGTVVFFALLAFFTRSVPLGGIDGTQAALSMISLAVPFALIAGVHVVYARVLMDYSRDP